MFYVGSIDDNGDLPILDDATDNHDVVIRIVGTGDETYDDPRMDELAIRIVNLLNGALR